MDDVSQVAGVNPLLQRVRLPGQTFPLPSGGLFYNNGELAPNVVNGEIHVYPMTAIDELVMKSVDKVFSGQAIKETFARCIPDVKKVGALSAKDVDFLLVALRKVSYGASFEVNYQHDCTDSKEHEYSVTLDTFLSTTKTINPVSMRTDFEFVLENGQKVLFKPATYDDIVKVYQEQHAEVNGISDESETDETRLDRLMNSVSILIGSVDGVTDRANILEWLKTIPILWLKALSTAARDTTEWGIKFDLSLTCKDCGAEVLVPTPLNPISFFI